MIAGDLWLIMGLDFVDYCYNLWLIVGVDSTVDCCGP